MTDEYSGDRTGKGDQVMQSGQASPNGARKNRHSEHWPMMLVDLFAQATAWGVTFMVIGPIVIPKRSTSVELALAIGLTLVGWLVGWYNGLYEGSVGRERTHTMLRTVRSLVFVTLLSALAGVAFNLAAKELGVGIALLWVVTLLGRSVVSARIRVRRSFGENHDRLIIVGANDEARQLVDLLELNPELGLDPVAIVGNAAEASLIGLDSLFRGPVLRAPEVISSLDVRYAVVMTGAIYNGELQDVIGMLKGTNAELMLAAELGIMQQRNLQARPIAFAPMFRVDEGAPHARKMAIKRVVDVSVAALALAVSLPIQAMAAVAIKLTDGGPILHRQTRLGINGNKFESLQLRTMWLDAPPNSAVQTTQTQMVWSDKRMTMVGRLLEITGVNELPQLWNILRGDMSIVGPQPGYPALDADTRVLAMRPGLTGIWRTEANLSPTSKMRLQVDDIYVENWSILLDTGILLSSIELIIARFLRGASWRHAILDEAQTRSINPVPVVAEPALS